MPRSTSGSVFRTANGYGIRWPEDGRRPQRTGFQTKTEARRWFAAEVVPRLDRGAPSPEVSFDAFCELFLSRHGARSASAPSRRWTSASSPARERSATGPSPSSKGPPTTSPAGGPGSPRPRATGSR